jgi:hypothetical protein
VKLINIYGEYTMTDIFGEFTQEQSTLLSIGLDLSFISTDEAELKSCSQSLLVAWAE